MIKNEQKKKGERDRVAKQNKKINIAWLSVATTLSQTISHWTVQRDWGWFCIIYCSPKRNEWEKQRNEKSTAHGIISMSFKALHANSDNELLCLDKMHPLEKRVKHTHTHSNYYIVRAFFFSSPSYRRLSLSLIFILGFIFVPIFQIDECGRVVLFVWADALP